MALLTRKGMDNLLERIWQTGGLTEDMETDIQRLRDDFDEREGILNRYGESYDHELEEYEFNERVREHDDTVILEDETVATETSDPVDTTRLVPVETDWQAMYNDLQRRYIDRFFGRDTGDLNEATIMKSQVSDTKRDGTIQSWEELLGTADIQYGSEMRIDESEKRR